MRIRELTRVSAFRFSRIGYGLGCAFLILTLILHHCQKFLAVQEFLRVLDMPMSVAASEIHEDPSFSEGLRNAYGFAPTALALEWWFDFTELLVSWCIISFAFASAKNNFLPAGMMALALTVSLYSFASSHPDLRFDSYNPYVIHANAFATALAGATFWIAQKRLSNSRGNKARSTGVVGGQDSSS